VVKLNNYCIGQGSHRAQINHVTRKFTIEKLVDVGAYLACLASSKFAQIFASSNLKKGSKRLEINQTDKLASKNQ
jgi:hypothetical protein